MTEAVNQNIEADYVKKLTEAGVEKDEAKREITILISEFGNKDADKIKKIIEERVKTRKPIQHILGKAFFMDFEVKVNENVLIPRPETEILVEETINRIKKNYDESKREKLKALDIGCGSGVIPIALCRMLPGIDLVSIDIQKETIKVAQENAKLNGVSEKIKFALCDLFSKDAEDLFNTSNFSLIISNPPYIKDDEVSKLEPEISLHEPKIALSGSKKNATGLIYYERILYLAKQSSAKFKIPMLVAFEIDPPIVNGLKKLLQKERLNNFEIIKDYEKLERCLFVYLNA